MTKKSSLSVLLKMHGLAQELKTVSPKRAKLGKCLPFIQAKSDVQLTSLVLNSPVGTGRHSACSQSYSSTCFSYFRTEIWF